jgi:hypothetical protein
MFDAETDEITVVPAKLFRTLVLLESTTMLIDAAGDGTAPGVDIVEAHFFERLTGTLGWLASCSYAGLLHMGAFYYASQLTAHAQLPRLSSVSGLREACRWWMDRAASGQRPLARPQALDAVEHPESALGIRLPIRRRCTGSSTSGSRFDAH